MELQFTTIEAKESHSPKRKIIKLGIEIVWITDIIMISSYTEQKLQIHVKHFRYILQVYLVKTSKKKGVDIIRLWRKL